MTIVHGAEIAGAFIVALAIFCAAWTTRIVAPAERLSVIGWIVNILTVIALVACIVRC